MKKPLRSIISERESELPEGEMEKLMKILVENKNIISLGPGEPDFSPPKHVINAVKKCAAKYTHYSTSEGRKELREAIAKKLKKENKIDASRENIVVTCGSSEAIVLALMSVVDPGEAVLVPDPGFVAYIPSVEMLNGVPISIPSRMEDKWMVNPDAIKFQLKEPKRCRAIILNTPNNPTGAVYPRSILEEIAGIAIENDLLIISDEAYEKFVYNGKHISIGSLNGMEDYVLTLQSFSKTYGMAGFRVGYASGPEKIINAMRTLHVYTSLCAPTLSQMAALSALKGKQEYAKHVKEYEKRRTFIHKRLNEIKGFHVSNPEGAFYAFAKYDFKMNSKQFCHWLIKNAKVSCVPGSDFGRYGEGFVRFSYATKFDKIKIAMDRIEKAVKKLN